MSRLVSEEREQVVPCLRPQPYTRSNSSAFALLIANIL
jgi:hypothetical protein